MKNYPNFEENPQYAEIFGELFAKYERSGIMESVISKLYRHGYCIFLKSEDVGNETSQILTNNEIPHSFHTYEYDNRYNEISLSF